VRAWLLRLRDYVGLLCCLAPSGLAFSAALDCFALGGVHPTGNVNWTFDSAGDTGCGAASGSPLVGGTYTSVAALIAAKEGAATCNGVSGGCTFISAEHCAGSGSVHQYQMTVTANGNGTTKTQNFRSITSGSPTNSCAADPNECAELTNVQAQGTGTLPINSDPPDEVCINMGPEIGRCAAFRRGKLNDGTTSCIPGTTLGCESVEYSKNDNGDGTADFLWRNQFTGLNCVAESDMPEETTTEGEACSGNFCAGPQARPGCGFFNDKYICPDSFAGDDECYTWDDGTKICAEGAPTPPKPDNGTPGVPADPDDQIDVCTGSDSCQTINHYNSTTTGGSSRDDDGPGSGDTGSGPGRTGTDGDGEEGSEEEGDESASGGEDCSAAPVCEGDVIDCAVLNQEWRARCPDTDHFEDLEELFGPADNGSGSFIGDGSSYTLPGAFNAEGFLGIGGGETCIDDVVIDLGGDLPEVTIPISTWCYWMSLIGLMILVSAYIGGIKLVMGGI